MTSTPLPQGSDRPTPARSTPDRPTPDRPTPDRPTPDRPTPDQPSAGQPGWTRRTRLRRSATDTVLGGVCGGLAEYSGIDALLWRVGLLALALAGPGALVYLLLFLLMPLGPAPAGVRPAPLDRLADRLRGRSAHHPPAV